MSEREELNALRKKLLKDIASFGRRLDFLTLVEQSIWCDAEQKGKRDLEKQIAAYCLGKSKRELDKVNAALQGLASN